MKKNIENNVTKNIVIEPIMDEETMQAVIEDNMHLVPRNQMKKFEALDLKHKMAKIQFYTDMAVMREQARIKNSIGNRVKELFDKRHATVEDAKEVLRFCTEFIDNFKVRELEKIDAEIAKLEELKLQFA